MEEEDSTPSKTFLSPLLNFILANFIVKVEISKGILSKSFLARLARNNLSFKTCSLRNCGMSDLACNFVQIEILFETFVLFSTLPRLFLEWAYPGLFLVHFRPFQITI